MAALNGTRSRLIHVTTAAIAALVILAPTLDEQATRAPTVPALAPPSGTQTVVPPTVPGPPAGIRPGAIDTLPALLDASARKLMDEQHAPGTAVAIVHAGQLIALRALQVIANVRPRLLRHGSGRPKLAGHGIWYARSGVVKARREIEALKTWVT